MKHLLYKHDKLLTADTFSVVPPFWCAPRHHVSEQPKARAHAARESAPVSISLSIQHLQPSCAVFRILCSVVLYNTLWCSLSRTCFESSPHSLVVYSVTIL